MQFLLLAALCFVWAGMVLGISFLETPVKFTAPSVTLPIGLNIGRHVFGVFNKVEMTGALVAFGLMLLTRTPQQHAVMWLPLAAVLLIVALQTAWLLPILDARVGMILAGETPPDAPYHILYIVLEVVKLLCLITGGVVALGALRLAAADAAAGS